MSALDEHAGLRARFDATPLPLALLDDERRFVDANAAALALLGVERDALPSRSLDELVTPETKAELAELWPDIKDHRHLAVLVPTQRRTSTAASVLSGREREILARVAQGQDGPQIAADLVVSPATVRTHVGNAIRKLGARSRAHAVAIALRSGVLDDGELEGR